MNAEEFPRHRARLRAIAYRMLGSAADAEDVVQEAWVRWSAAESVESAEAWLVTTVSRLCLDRLKSARATRESYIGPWLPEPIATGPDEIDDESVSMAFLILLERLSPLERAVYLLHKVFELSHAEVAARLGKTEAAVRQAFHRAETRVVAEKPRFAPSKERHAELLAGFASACTSGDLLALEAMLAKDARALTDAGGKTRAARKVVKGGSSVARLFLGLVRKGELDGLVPELRELNGWPAVLWTRDGVLQGMLGIETDGTTIHAVHVVLNPEKLKALATTNVAPSA